MNHKRASSGLAALVLMIGACSSSDSPGPVGKPSAILANATVLRLDQLKASPDGYAWMDFRPNVKKLILAGAAETEHVAILWYTIAEGAVGLHYHAKTESVYVIDGTQTDAKGVYPTGTVYFNPPGSGHEIMRSSGFFVLAYAAPPDFTMTDRIGPYTPVRIDTKAADLRTQNAFEARQPGARVFSVPLAAGGGLAAELVEVTSGTYTFKGNYLLVVEGRCLIEGQPFDVQTLVVPKTVAPQPFQVKAPAGSACLMMGVSF